MNRIRLTFARNKDTNTKAYRVYRKSSPGVTRRDMLVMEIEHPELPVPVAIEHAKLERESGFSYKAPHISIMPEAAAYPVTVLVNGINAELLGISYDIDYAEGRFHFLAMLNEGDEVLASYHIDAIQVIDTDEIQQDGVNYFGPTARDRTETTVPGNVSLLPDPANGRLILTWADAFAQGQNYHYRIESVDDLGNFSNLSPERYAFLKEGTDTQAYIVERSVNGSNWIGVARQTEREYIEYGIDREPPDPPTNVTNVVVPVSGSATCNMELNWTAASEGRPSPSGEYRIRSVSSNGVVSNPSVVVGPVYLTSSIRQYVIRRKIWDGSFPSYAGNDAITAGTVDAPTTTFLDVGLPDNTDMAYSIFAVDSSGNYSVAATLLARTLDNTAPPQVDGLKVSVYSYII